VNPRLYFFFFFFFSFNHFRSYFFDYLLFHSPSLLDHGTEYKADETFLKGISGSKTGLLDSHRIRLIYGRKVGLAAGLSETFPVDQPRSPDIPY
jgi:hypothetical protein